MNEDTAMVWACVYLTGNAVIRICAQDFVATSPRGVLHPQPVGAVADYVSAHPSFTKIPVPVSEAPVPVPEPEENEPEEDENEPEEDENEGGESENSGSDPTDLSEMSWGQLRKLAKDLGITTHGLRRAEVEAAVAAELEND
jgi:hypothetical protein